MERELGRGGMATVYLARDLRHDRPVALKVLHQDLAAGGVLAVPSHMSRDRLRIDPHFTPLRDHPQFRRLVEGAG